jgi:valyl-tRNA synthetase
MLSFLTGLLGTHLLLIIGLVALLAFVFFSIAVYNKYKNNPAQVVVDAVTGVETTATSSVFSGILSAAGSTIGGLFSSVEQYIVIGLLTTLLVTGGAFYFYYDWSQGKLQLAAVNQQKLEDAVNQQRDAFDKLKKDTDNLAKSYQDLQKKQNQIQKKNDELEKKFQQYDFQNNAIKNHDATEKDINDQTAKMLKDLENLTDPNNLNDPSDSTDTVKSKK